VENIFKKTMRQLDFDILKRPEKLKKFASKVILVRILGIVISDMLAFSIKGAEIALKSELPIIAILLLLLHFSERTVSMLYKTYDDLQEYTYTQISTSESTKIILFLSNTIKGKVFKKKDNISTRVEHPEIIKVAKDYLDDSWRLLMKIPYLASQTIMLLFTIGLSIYLELVTASKLESIIISVLLVSSVILYFFMSKRRIEVMKNFRKFRKENESKTEVLYTELKMIDFISSKDFFYHASKLRECLDTKINTEKDEMFKLNKVFISRSVISSLFMVAIIMIKVIISGEFNLIVFLDVVALSSIYSSILGRISSIAGNCEDVMDILVDMDTLYPDFKSYHDKYVEETSKNVVLKPIKNIQINHFSTSQDPNGRFELINMTPLSICSRAKILVHGHTGCGKSTLLYLLTGRITQEEAPIVFSNGLTGYLNSISYQTDKAMANNFVLNEICLTDDLATIDQHKLFEILKGLKMFGEVLKMVTSTELDTPDYTPEYKVFRFLETRKISEFSSGQVQRLSLAKLLYQLDDTIQLVALDEPFNRLDDETCDVCCNFVTDYIMNRDRILILATHQVQICKKYCTSEIFFTEDLNKSYINAK